MFGRDGNNGIQRLSTGIKLEQVGLGLCCLLSIISVLNLSALTTKRRAKIIGKRKKNMRVAEHSG